MCIKLILDLSFGRFMFLICFKCVGFLRINKRIIYCFIRVIMFIINIFKLEKYVKEIKILN